jgi:sulfatase modifying factor 1
MGAGRWSAAAFAIAVGVLSFAATRAVLRVHTATPAPPVPAPPGMVYVPGAITHIGSEDGPPDEQPVFRARVAPFFMDVHPVTVAQFRAFVEATGHVSDAERAGSAGVADPRTREWRLVAGANWRYPLGPDGATAPDDHPVTQVSWYDATAFAKWSGKRLPTEIEWEHAARSARDERDRYPWGNDLDGEVGPYANTWDKEDGWVHTSPVGTYGATVLGLTDVGGNVWEWTEDWFRPYPDRDRPPTVADHEKVQRGGSFLCDPTFCHGFRVSARSHSSPETALFHVGFRLVQDLPAR